MFWCGATAATEGERGTRSIIGLDWICTTPPHCEFSSCVIYDYWIDTGAAITSTGRIRRRPSGGEEEEKKTFRGCRATGLNRNGSSERLTTWTSTRNYYTKKEEELYYVRLKGPNSIKSIGKCCSRRCDAKNRSSNCLFVVKFDWSSSQPSECCVIIISRARTSWKQWRS